MVDYALELIATKHDSARVHGIMFFSYVLLCPSKVILDYFDAKDGVRKLFNVISTLKILQSPNPSSSDNDSHAEKTCAKMASICLKRYVERHLVIRADALNISTSRYIDSNKLATSSKQPIFELATEIGANSRELKHEYLFKPGFEIGSSWVELILRLCDR